MRSLVDVSAAQKTPMKGGEGQSLKHESAEKHVTGEALYTDDLVTPANILHGYVGLSTIARGLIKKMDLSQVKAFPGVVDVLTLDDVPGHYDIGPVYPGDPVLADGEVQFWGQPLFAVAATSYKAARKAASLAVLEYEPIKPVVSIEEGLQAKYFVRPSHTQKRGDARKAIDEAAHRLQGELHIGGQEHFSLEGQVSMAVPTEDDGVLLYTSSQHPSEGQKLVAQVLGIAINRVTVDMRRMGGGFGGKETNANQWACLAALLMHKTGRAVKIRLARSDDMCATGKRHPFLIRYDVGFNQQGLIEGVDITLSAACGMSPDLSDAIVDRAMFHADNAYFFPAACITGHRVKTDTVSNTAFRGFGGPQGMLGIEGIMDDIARVVNKDPLDIRKRNFYSDSGKRNMTHYGQTIEHMVIADLVDRLEHQSDYRVRREQIKQFNAANKVFKKGIALTPVKFGISFTAQHLNQAGALVHVYTDGSIQLNHGGTEMGQGLFTKVAQIVATQFQVDIDTVLCTSTRTDKVPNTSPTAASSGTDLNGMAAKEAATTIKLRMINFAATHFSVEQDDVNFIDNQVIAGDHCLSFSQFCQLAYLHRVSLSATGFYRTPKIYYDREKAQGQPFFYFANGAAVSEVLVDTLTGEYKVLRVDICHDVGQSINPMIDRGQIEGGFIQGMGWLTTEELLWDKHGKLLTNNPASYKIPTMADTPAIFNVELLPNSPNTEATVFHSKAVGEPPLMLAISVWSALRDAVSSVSNYQINPLLDTPATPERVLHALQALKERRTP
ncbi:MAG: xanthine dehydrogenase molybdopterin binding subunit [Spongiibacteraceae bacterium]|nr:xanthine dehydrogenase molybdopterin binding subunit [Spongiibacteraceae bacterium]